MAAAGVTANDLRLALSSTSPSYVVDVMGNWLVRSNMGMFAALLQDPRVAAASRRFQHVHFGLKIMEEEGTMLFLFHTSLIRSIVAEASAPGGEGTCISGQGHPAGRLDGLQGLGGSPASSHDVGDDAHAGGGRLCRQEEPGRPCA